MEIKIKVSAEASKAKIIKEKNRLLVYVKSEKTKNMANQEVVQLVSEYFKVPLEKVKIRRGQRSENKVLEIHP